MQSFELSLLLGIVLIFFAGGAFSQIGLYRYLKKTPLIPPMLHIELRRPPGRLLY